MPGIDSAFVPTLMSLSREMAADFKAGSARGPSDMMLYLQAEHMTIGPDDLARPGRGRATFVSFVPGGTAWYIRYSTNQCLWGPDIKAFPSTWRSIMHDLDRNHPRKDDCIEFVAFGPHEVLLIRFENGNFLMQLPEDPAVRSRISPDLIKEVEERLAAGWTLGNRTALCEFDTNRWFIEWKRGTGAEFRYSMGCDEQSKQDTERVTKVLSGVGNDPALVASQQNAQLVGVIILFEALVIGANFYANRSQQIVHLLRRWPSTELCSRMTLPVLFHALTPIPWQSVFSRMNAN